MKKLLRKANNPVFIFCLILLSQKLSAQTIEKYYVNMPDVLNPTLSKQNRLELLEYHKAGQGDSIDNRLGNKTYLMSFDTLSQRIVVRNTESSTFEMKVLSLNDSTRIIGIIRTVCAPLCQSVVEFYDTAWNLVPIRFTMPKAIDWIDKGAYTTEAVDFKWLNNVLENSFISLSFDSMNQLIIAKNNSLEFVSEVDRKLISPLVVDKTLLFRLEGRKWVLEP